jgi:hypothetical protein
MAQGFRPRRPAVPVRYSLCVAFGNQSPSRSPSLHVVLVAVVEPGAWATRAERARTDTAAVKLVRPSQPTAAVLHHHAGKKIKNPTTPFHSPALPGGSVRPAGGFARTRGPSRPRRTLPCFPTRALHQPRASPCPPRRPPPYIPSGLHPPPQLISPHQVLLLLPPVLRPPEAAAQQAKPLPRPRYS